MGFIAILIRIGKVKEALNLYETFQMVLYVSTLISHSHSALLKQYKATGKIIIAMWNSTLEAASVSSCLTLSSKIQFVS